MPKEIMLQAVFRGVQLLAVPIGQPIYPGLQKGIGVHRRDRERECLDEKRREQHDAQEENYNERTFRLLHPVTIPRLNIGIRYLAVRCRLLYFVILSLAIPVLRA